MRGNSTWRRSTSASEKERWFAIDIAAQAIQRMANVFRSATLAGPCPIGKLPSSMSWAAVCDVQCDFFNVAFQFARLTHGITERSESRDERRSSPLASDTIGPVATFGRIGPPPASLVSRSPRDAVVTPIWRAGDGVPVQGQLRKTGVEELAHGWTYPRDLPQASQSSAINSMFPR